MGLEGENHRLPVQNTRTLHHRLHDGEAVVFTFDPHPRKVIQPDTAPRLLTTPEQKHELLEEIGVDVVIAEPFDLEFAKIPPDVFVRDYIYERIRPVEVYVGYDFHFGRDRQGSMRSLTENGPQLGFAVTIIPEVKSGGRDVNSTRIRSLLEAGEVVEAAEMLGRRYGLRGTVVVGDRRGRTLGFPTLNILPENEVMPCRGVYAGLVRFLGEDTPYGSEQFDAVVNVGLRPTFADAHGLSVEAHLLDFDDDVYGRRVELEFVARLRNEQKFATPDALKQQIQLDAEAARRELKSK
jgi:riboflavin kinase/FMN adenylyltransferase